MDYDFKAGLDAVRFLRERASCRNFEDKPIDDGLLRDILSAACAAATGGNLQPFSILVERDKERNKQLCELCGGQKFVEEAPVNLIFLLDWYKFSVYAAQKKAPFTCDHSYMHFLIGVEDVMCAAQTVETAAHLCGLGSCYVGTSNSCGEQIAAMYDLPKLTYPVILLSVGHPKKRPPVAKKLPYDMTVFESKYPALTEQQIFDGFEAKYGGRKFDLPQKEEHRTQYLEMLERSLLTSYSEEETKEILAKIAADGYMNETQRRFGLHYHAAEMINGGKDVLRMMREQGFEPFTY